MEKYFGIFLHSKMLFRHLRASFFSINYDFPTPRIHLVMCLLTGFAHLIPLLSGLKKQKGTEDSNFY